MRHVLRLTRFAVNNCLGQFSARKVVFGGGRCSFFEEQEIARQDVGLRTSDTTDLGDNVITWRLSSKGLLDLSGMTRSC